MTEASDISDNTNGIHEADLIFAMGIRFWSKLVISEDIVNVERCSQVLEIINSVIDSSKQIYVTFPEDEEIAEIHLTPTVQQNEAEYDIYPVEEELSSIFLEDNNSSNFKALEEENIFDQEISKKYQCEFCDFQHNQFVVLKTHMLTNHKSNYASFLIQNNLYY